MVVNESEYVNFLLKMGVKYYPSITCACGCNGLIKVKIHHKNTGIPKYVYTHHLIGNKYCSGREPWNKNTKGMCKSNKTTFKKGNDPWNKNLDITDERVFLSTRKPDYYVHPFKGKTYKEDNRIFHKENPIYPRGLTKEYCNWRKYIYKRDNYTCQICKQRGGKLNAHHILKVADNPEYELEKWNGITLCKKCHQKTFYHEYAFVLKFLAYTGTIEEI